MNPTDRFLAHRAYMALLAELQALLDYRRAEEIASFNQYRKSVQEVAADV